MQLRLCAVIILTFSVYVNGGKISSAVELHTPMHDTYDALAQIEVADCFSIYMEDLQVASTKYQKALTVCQQKSAKDLSDLEESTADDRKTVKASASVGCLQYSECNKKILALEFFECYVTASKEASTHFASAKANADNSKREVKQRQNTIAYEKDQCDTKANDDNFRELDKINEELQTCLKNAGLPGIDDTADSYF